MRSWDPFEEDVDGDEGRVALADEVSGVDVVHADAGGGVKEDEMMVGAGHRPPALLFQCVHEFRLGGMTAFDIGLDGPDHTVAARVPGDAEKADGGAGDLRGEHGHALEILEWRGEAEAVGVADGAADDERADGSFNFPCVVLGSTAFDPGLVFKRGDFLSREDPVIGFGPAKQGSFLAFDFLDFRGKGVFPYGRLRELAKRLFRRNCDVRSSGDKLCGSGLMWPKSGGVCGGFPGHGSADFLSAFMTGGCGI